MIGNLKRDDVPGAIAVLTAAAKRGPITYELTATLLRMQSDSSALVEALGKLPDAVKVRMSPYPEDDPSV